jgi:hypothetical protein
MTKNFLKILSWREPAGDFEEVVTSTLWNESINKESHFCNSLLLLLSAHRNAIQFFEGAL